ncbi:Cytochrome P450, E-class, group I [Trema orientale]|uniref:Cytochrome P450, E-class, group I n=1 Tax=Trema orientale TaxID=63057 RepID=A0A2P5CZI1_TREOI|nr:Cytochrome P450, E-class, group I [Trema orientale]
MNKVVEELRTKETPFSEQVISQLPYLNACFKETLRLHPPAPFLLPHFAPETCEVMNYTVPKNSRVFVNVWAIGRDPTFWEDPLLFKPDRFLGSNLEFKGHDFEFLPFGSGRRICPGLMMGSKQVLLIMANLVRFFDWSLPNNDDPGDLDMGERLGITMQKEQPLLLIPKIKI